MLIFVNRFRYAQFHRCGIGFCQQSLEFQRCVLHSCTLFIIETDFLRTCVDVYYKSTQSPKILLLTGPVGVGKSATVRVLARELGYDITEWINPVRHSTGMVVEDERGKSNTPCTMSCHSRS